MEKYSDKDRVAVVLGLLGVYVAIVFGVYSIVSDNLYLTVIKYTIYFWFGFICLLFILYLNYVLIKQKYLVKKSKIKISDASIVFQGLLWSIFKNREFNKMSREEFRNRIYKRNKNKNWDRFYFNKAVEVADYFPRYVIFILSVYFLNNILINLGLSLFWRIGTILVGGIILGVFLNMLRYMFIGEQ